MPGREIDARMARDQIGRDAGVGHRQILDGDIAHLLAHCGHQAVAADHAAAGHPEIEVCDDLQLAEGAGPTLKHVELAGQVHAADQRADGRAADDVRSDAGPPEGMQHADMGPAACHPAAQSQADARPIFGFSPARTGQPPCTVDRRLRSVR